jgi:hypothetical protein
LLSTTTSFCTTCTQVPYTLYGDLVKMTRLSKAAQTTLLGLVAECCAGRSADFAAFASSLDSIVSAQSVNTSSIALATGACIVQP